VVEVVEVDVFVTVVVEVVADVDVFVLEVVVE
jgi:hypothetical protein